MKLLLFLLLTLLVGVVGYTDWKVRKVYHMVLLPGACAGLILHLLNGTAEKALILMGIAFFFFYLVYAVGMTSPGDVKWFAVLAAITADARVLSGTLVLYMTVQFALALHALWKVCRSEQRSWREVLKQDAVGFVTKTGSVIAPVQFPGAVILGGGVWVCEVFFIWIL